ncbi:hypothetical protein NPIL_678291 [Nephila pilipes]|uniref:Uncharacterized protein n=1 Tax=Nephila pilipes TaxID=299642 RepID=A0A8X6PL18_NEPPI|nr:hypothetical protein NPIL_678291 [Nephila pilipes]
MFRAEELKEAEIKVKIIVQKSSFSSSNDQRLRNMPHVVDKNELLRMKTRLTFREDTEDFKFPLILPSYHPVVTIHRQTGTSAQAKKIDRTSRMTQPIQTTNLGRKVKTV